MVISEGQSICCIPWCSCLYYRNQLGQSVEVTGTFSVTDSADAVLAIFRAITGNTASLKGLGIAAAGIGEGSILEVTNADGSKISSNGHLGRQ